MTYLRGLLVSTTQLLGLAAGGKWLLHEGRETAAQMTRGEGRKPVTSCSTLKSGGRASSPVVQHFKRGGVRAAEPLLGWEWRVGWVSLAPPALINPIVAEAPRQLWLPTGGGVQLDAAQPPALYTSLFLARRKRNYI